MDSKKRLFLDEAHIPIIIQDVLKNLWLGILAAVVVCICVFAYDNLGHQPSYSTEATFVVSPRSNGAYVGFYSSLSTANEMASVFKEVFSSDVLKRLIREDLQKPGLVFSVNASVATGTNILTVTVQAASPETAHEVIQSVLKNYRQVSGYLFGGVVLDVLKKPQISVTPSNPFHASKYMVLGSACAVLLMSALVAAVSFLRPTIKTLACAKRRMEDVPLAILRKERKNGLLLRKLKNPLLITNSGTSFQYTESLLRLAYKVRHKMKKQGAKILLVTSVAENEGKSTVSANLALAIAKHGYKVACVDMDLRKPAVHKIFQDFPREDLRACLTGDLPASLDDEKRLHIISYSKLRPGTDKMLRSEELEKLLDTLREKMDYVVLDTSPYTATADTGILMRNADCCLMVVRQDWVPYGICAGVEEELHESDAQYLGYVLNHYWDDGSAKIINGDYDKYGYYSSQKGNDR